MTPNKLPPLPHTWYVMKDEETEAFDAEHMHVYGSLCFESGYAAETMQFPAEALRQSQSLPAGAVAGLVGKWREHGERQYQLADGIGLSDVEKGWHNGRSEQADACADELEQALQADAREKGEAAEIEPGWKLIAVNGKDFDNLVYWLNELDLPNVLDKAWAAFDYRLATQPAQASEKDNG